MLLPVQKLTSLCQRYEPNQNTFYRDLTIHVARIFGSSVMSDIFDIPKLKNSEVINKCVGKLAFKQFEKSKHDSLLSLIGILDSYS
mgnify:CR=1 FL=1